MKQWAADPTTEQIRKRAAEIREGWDEKTERRRHGLPTKPEPYAVPVFCVMEGRDTLEPVAFEWIE